MRVDRNEYELELHNRGSMYEYISTLAHELVHLKQYDKAELRFKHMKQYWMGVDMTDVAYEKQPWEIEARKLQPLLAKDFIESETKYTVKECEDLSPRTLKTMDWQQEFNIIDRYCPDE